MLNKNEMVEVEITGLTSEGNGVGRAGGQAVFVPMTAPGDRARVKIAKVQKGYAYGILQELMLPSPFRTKNACPVFAQCGGCSLRHLSYEAELRAKEDMVRENLRRIGKIEAPVLPIQPSPATERYRNKGIYPVTKDESGQIRIGFYARRSHRVVDCDDCLLQPESYGKILRIFKAFLLEYDLPVYEETGHSGEIRGIYIRAGFRSGELLVCIISTKPVLPHAQEFVGRLTGKIPQVKTVVLNCNPERTNVALGKINYVLYGKGAITDVLCGRKFEISPLSFYQVNSRAAELLYGLAADFAELKEGEVLLDLYCGIGTIGISMARPDTRLIGVEVVRDAVDNAKRNARLNGLVNARFLCGTAETAAQQLVKEGLRPDVVVVDPPRKGCEASAVESICQMEPKRVIYISCNSATLARDCQRFAEFGYRVVKAQSVDMFPRTTHVETVCLLYKLNAKQHIEVELNMDELDLTAAESKATYEEIKDYVLGHSGMKVSSLCIAQVKQKCGIIERENYNKPKAEDKKQPKCPSEKEAAIIEALKIFGMI